MGVMVYALWTYHWRAYSIRRGSRGPYDDRVGPVSISRLLPAAFLSCPYFVDNPVCCAARYVFLPVRWETFSIIDDFVSVAIIINFVLRFSEPDSLKP